MVFPAYAGVSPWTVSFIEPLSSLPRLRGGEPFFLGGVKSACLSSPPTRG